MLDSEVEAVKKQAGRKSAITDKIQKCLVVRGTLNSAYYQMAYKEIALLKSV